MKVAFPLLFDWPSRHSVNLALPAMLIVSVLAHVAGIAAFRMAPPRKLAGLRQAEVFVLRPSPDFAGGSLAAIEAADPSLFSASASEVRALWNLRPSEYTPSFDMPEGIEARVGFRPLPQVHPADQTRPMPGPVPVPAPGVPPAPAVRFPLTRVVFSRGPLQIEMDAPISPGAGESLRPAEFFVTAGPGGKVTNALLLVSSGSEPADAAATRFLLSTSLPGVKSGVSGSASVLWGWAPPAKPQSD